MIGCRAAALLLLGSFAAPAATQPAVPPDSAIRAAVTAIYARYRGPMLAGGPADDLALYSRRTRNLVARWQGGQPQDEVTPMGDFDWFCQCQDYDEKSFAVTGLTIRKARDGAYEAAVAYDLGWGSKARLTLVMIREEGDWKVDDIRFAPDAGPRALRAALTKEIADFAKPKPPHTGEHP